MADRTSAEIFGIIFDLLSNPTLSKQEIAQQLLEMTLNYDFSFYQMGVHDEVWAALNIDVSQYKEDD